MRFTVHAVAALAASLLAAAAPAQDFPSRPIRIIVPTSVSTSSDLSARFLAEQLPKDLGVNVIVENKVGANGILGVQQLAAAPADGHTLLLTNSALYANPALYKNVSYDPARDWRILIGISQVFLVLVAAPNLPVSTLKELVAYARERPGKVSYASAGAGSTTHLGPELLASRAGIKLSHVPYKGGAQAVTDTAGGHVDLAMTAVPTAAPLVQAGKLKALAVTGGSRSGAMPNVPTVAEAGVPGAEIISKQAIVAQAGLPDAIAAKLTAAFAKAIRTPEYQKFLEVQGIEREPMPPELYSKTAADELKAWAEMVRLSGAKFD